MEMMILCYPLMSLVIHNFNVWDVQELIAARAELKLVADLKQ